MMTLRSMSLLAVVPMILIPALIPASSLALTTTASECDEGAEFIANAARSRDNGLSSEAFFERFDGDLLLLQSIPPDLRWFVRDHDDEALLRGAALQVFTARRTPDEHARAFLAQCHAAVDAVRTHSPLPAGAGGET